ncbi:MAG: hypothetical protein PHS38_15635 [Bacteroidales bacterium]|jgi:hypothetical protein|nr:hypothetical protein [Bacteroidales bacterium]
MTSLELLQEIDAWLSFNNSPSKEQISELRNDIKKHISEQLNILHVSDTVCDNYDPEIGFPTGNGKCKNCGKYHEE